MGLLKLPVDFSTRCVSFHDIINPLIALSKSSSEIGLGTYLRLSTLSTET